MLPSLSAYLDIIRLLAAVTVFFIHAAQPRISHGVLDISDRYGRDAVVVFFVLSGFVIRYVAEAKERTLQSYAISRVARIYSVAIPALTVTFLVDCWLVYSEHSGAVPMYQMRHPLVYLPVFLTFTTDIWFLKEDTLSDGAYWSLCYEVWYYVAFGCCYYLAGQWRIIATVAVLAIMGPKLWLLAPVWLAGVAAYELQKRYRIGNAVACIMFVGSILALIVLWSGVDLQMDHAVDRLSGGWVVQRMRYSQDFLSYWIAAVLIGANLYSASQIRVEIGSLGAWIAPAAASTFALYLFHIPLLQTLEPYRLPFPLLLTAVLAAVLVVGPGCEALRRWMRSRLVASLAWKAAFPSR